MIINVRAFRIALRTERANLRISDDQMDFIRGIRYGLLRAMKLLEKMPQVKLTRSEQIKLGRRQAHFRQPTAE